MRLRGPISCANRSRFGVVEIDCWHCNAIKGLICSDAAPDQSPAAHPLRSAAPRRRSLMTTSMSFRIFDIGGRVLPWHRTTYSGSSRQDSPLPVPQTRSHNTTTKKPNQAMQGRSALWFISVMNYILVTRLPPMRKLFSDSADLVTNVVMAAKSTPLCPDFHSSSRRHEHLDKLVIVIYEIILVKLFLYVCALHIKQKNVWKQTFKIII